MFQALAPDRDWTWMLPLIRRLKSTVKPTNKHSVLPSIGELFALGVALMDRADDGQFGTPKERALMYRNGLSIAVLAARPVMRRDNLARIRIGKHLVRDGNSFRLAFAEDEMKGRRARGGPLPAALTGRIECYLRDHRPILLGSKPGRNAFWISAMGDPIYPKAMSHEIGKVTEAAFGRRLTTHAFRHAAASSIAKEDPAHVGIVTTILGHADFRTSERYYIHAEENAAFVRMNNTIERLRANE
jgi:integrase